MGRYIPGGSPLDVVIQVDNSVSQGIVSWGGNAFPIAVNDPGHYLVGVRDDNGDRVELDFNWAGEPPIDPPFFVMEVTDQAGDFADVGSNAWVNFNANCRSINNSGRWETAAGVARSVFCSFDITYINAPAQSCPGTTTFAVHSYSIAANFTG